MACRQLGHAGGVRLPAAGRPADADGAAYVSGSLACAGGEAALANCTLTLEDDDGACSNDDDGGDGDDGAFAFVGVACEGEARPAAQPLGRGRGLTRVRRSNQERLLESAASPALPPHAGAANVSALRLAGGWRPAEGRLEARLEGGGWGPVCAPPGGEQALAAARVACYHLGYGTDRPSLYRGSGEAGDAGVENRSLCRARQGGASLCSARPRARFLHPPRVPVSDPHIASPSPCPPTRRLLWRPGRASHPGRAALPRERHPAQQLHPGAGRGGLKWRRLCSPGLWRRVQR